MEGISTGINGVVILKPCVFEDARGYFFESFSEREFERITGVKTEFIQDNQALSGFGVIRGLHFQKGDQAQAKLVRAVEGKILDVAVDIRKDSPTYGKYVAVELSDENKLQLFIPRGFAHGYAVLSEKAVVLYKTDNFYCPESEGGVLWNDPAIGIDWRLPEDDIVLSRKDRAWPLLSSLE